MNWEEEPLTAMSLCRNEMQIVAGNTRGDIGLFDLRNKSKIQLSLIHLQFLIIHERHEQ